MTLASLDSNETVRLMDRADRAEGPALRRPQAAGERAADLLTLLSSAVGNDQDVWVYVNDGLDRMPAGDRKCPALQPDRWTGASPESIRD